MKKRKTPIFSLLVILLTAAILAGAFFGQNQYLKASDTVISAGLSDKINSYIMPVRLIAHRGLSGLAPENTLAAVRAAGTADYYGCEFDIRLTADDRWVVLHNSSVDDMTDGEGAVSELTFDKLRSFHIDAGENVIQYPDEKIPSLEEMLDACKENDLIPFIEIKLESTQSPDYADLARIIREKGFEDCNILSFSMDSLIRLKNCLPTASYWLLVSKLTTQIIAQCAENGIEGIDFNASKFLNYRYIDSIAKADLLVAAWTVDNIHLMEKLYSKGVYNITTNKITPV